MNKDKIVLATSDNGTTVTVSDINKFIADKDRKALAIFIYDRLYGRYIKPHDYPSDSYIKNYKNGFAIMASCCLLIETYVSFKAKEFRKTKNLSGQCFGYFFTTEERFKAFSKGGRQKDGTISTIKQCGIPNDFFINVRCGILHNGETKNGWKITRIQTKPLLNQNSKEINAVKFLNNMKAILKDYKTKLTNSNYDDEVWVIFLNRLEDLINEI